MPRHSPTNQRRKRFFQLFRIPSSSAADSSSQFVTSDAVHGAPAGGGQRLRFIHFKKATSEGYNQEGPSERTNTTPRNHLFHSLKSGNNTSRGIASSGKMGNVQQVPVSY
ncbi:unnamed protein product [Rodentolepis nana]|uniref:CKK domain-containing protein n=1 Tax=Rodentolepis nana TaxID=102285 RepID=A0A0R3T9P9_RODNA|nr:unnamed protein product [Rodentolepis nana]